MVLMNDSQAEKHLKKLNKMIRINYIFRTIFISIMDCVAGFFRGILERQIFLPS